MNENPEKDGNNQAYQEKRKLISKLFNFSFPGVPDEINDFGFQVVLVRKP
jgi:hypothetical protein